MSSVKLMKKKILIACNDPGGTMAVMPVIKSLLKQKDIISVIYGGVYASSVFKKDSIPCRLLPIINIGKQKLPVVENILKRESPDLVFTSTSFGKVVDNAFLYAAVKKDIPTFALIDQWCNYSARFKVYSETRALPDYIGIMDRSAQSEMLKEGFPRNRLVVTGQPYFDSLACDKSAFNNESRRVFRRSHGATMHDVLVVFAAEPFKKGDLNIIGYTDIQILESLVESLEAVAVSLRKKIKLIIKLHPRDKRPISIFPLRGSPRVSVEAAYSGNARDFILNADIVTGMASIFLIESCLLQKPTLSIQIGLKSPDALITNKIGLTWAIRSSEELTEALSDILKGKHKAPSSNMIKIDGKATERVVMFLNRMLRNVA